jgi:ubiquinone/menaquinone biosynthesis C-methylase UbiE/uncharacterized Zn finger protein (UPF0148 family)
MVSLSCPRCDTLLVEQTDQRSVCPACKVEFPILTSPTGQVPFLWSEPEASLLDWQNRFNAALADLDTQISSAQAIDAAGPATQRRLNHLNAALSQHQQELQDLFSSLQVGETLAKETHLALRTRLPSHHGALSYAQNIHRDWCWGDTENKQVLTHLMSVVKDGPKPVNALILGCGAGRLAYDLHEALNLEETWAVDSNPLLCLLGQRMCAGEQLEFTEFPLAPIATEDCAVRRVLTAPAPIEGIRFVCADALRLPFAPAQFDLVITPWLLDVIDAGVKEVIQGVYRVTKPGGRWLNHGSVAFTGGQALNRMTQEELAELTTEQGFAVTQCQDMLLPYLQSPASRHRRSEITYTQLALRDQAQADKRQVRHQHLPEWIVTGRDPVPLSPGLQTQITTTRIHAFIMSLIDGKRSVLDMAKVLEEQRLMPAQQGVMAIRMFLTTMLEEARRFDGQANL